MAQREEHPELRLSPETTTTTALCANNCGLPCNPATNTMCQSCSLAAPAPFSKPRSAPIRPAPSRPDPGRDQRAEAADISAAAAPLKANRCAGCRRRVGLTGIRCRCGELFCAEHRYTDRHVCGFDYKAAGREAISRENPTVRAAKIVRI